MNSEQIKKELEELDKLLGNHQWRIDMTEADMRRAWEIILTTFKKWKEYPHSENDFFPQLSFNMMLSMNGEYCRLTGNMFCYLTSPTPESMKQLKAYKGRKGVLKSRRPNHRSRNCVRV